MHNVRREGDYLVYDCNAADCRTPGEPHKIHINDVMAVLDATYREHAAQADPRAEVMLTVFQLMWQQNYASGSQGQPLPTKDDPWRPEYRKLIARLMDEELDDDNSPPKKGTAYLN